MSDGSSSGAKWSDEDVQKLISLCASGVTKAGAAEAFGCSVNRVVSKGRKLGLSFLREDSWTDADMQKLRELAAEDKTALEIAETLGRTCCAVETKAHINRIYISSAREQVDKPARYGDAWTVSDEKLLAERLSEQCSVEELVNELGRSSKAIRSHMSVLGLRLCNSG